MKRKYRLPDSELEIMLIIWKLGKEVSTTQIMKELDSNKSVQLLQSYIKRLEDKGFIEVKKLGRLNFYTPLISLEDYRNKETMDFLEFFYQKSPIKLFASLISNNKITKQEIDEIRKMTEDDE